MVVPVLIARGTTDSLALDEVDWMRALRWLSKENPPESSLESTLLVGSLVRGVWVASHGGG